MPSGTASSSRSAGSRRTEFTANTESTVLARTPGACYTSGMMIGPIRPGDGADYSALLRTLGTTRQLITSIAGPSRHFGIELRAATTAQLDFQKLVADLATLLSAIGPAAVDEAIVDSLRQAGEALQLDCAVLWQKSAREATVVPTHSWVRSSCGWTCEGATMNDVPASDSELVRLCGLKSGAVVPITTFSGASAALTFGSMTRELSWTAATAEGVRLIGGIVSQALARMASHVALQQANDEIRRLRDR